MYNIDHFMIASNNLESLAEHFTQLTGISVAAGGSHPDLGTRNKLIATTSAVYLELIAPDPALETRSDLLEVIERIDVPVVHRMILLGKLSDFPAIVQAYERAGIPAVVRSLSRATPSGEVLRWHLLMPAGDNELGIFAPLFIDWGDATHPSRSLPSAPCTLADISASHPQPEKVQALWKEIGVDLPLQQGPEARLTIVLDTPKGRVQMQSA